jgi:hypothetical protein
MQKNFKFTFKNERNIEESFPIIEFILKKQKNLKNKNKNIFLNSPNITS